MKKGNNESNCYIPARKEGKFLLRPVPPYNFGEGLPYAPIDWPNPGDNWSWSVSRRIRSGGYYHDRYLYLPRRLQKHPRKRQRFLSKISIERYIKSKFPAADIDAFFASFTWKVPATKNFWTKGQINIRHYTLSSLITPFFHLERKLGFGSKICNLMEFADPSSAKSGLGELSCWSHAVKEKCFREVNRSQNET
jgi:hypothetical protein